MKKKKKKIKMIIIKMRKKKMIMMAQKIKRIMKKIMEMPRSKRMGRRRIKMI